MKALNHAKIIQAVEKALQADHADFVFDFLKAYGAPASTIKRIRMGDSTRNLAKAAGDIALSRELYYRAVPAGSSLSQNAEEIKQSPVFIKNKIRFILVTDFESVYCYDLKVDDTFSGDFAELKSNYDFFLPLTGKYEKAVAYAEHPADAKACAKMGRLYDSIKACNHYYFVLEITYILLYNQTCFSLKPSNPC